MNKKAISILLTAAMGVSVLAAGTVTVSAAEKKDKYVIGMSQCNLGEPWRVAMNDQIAMAAEKHPEFEVIFADAAQDNSKQIADIENFVQMGVLMQLVQLMMQESRLFFLIERLTETSILSLSVQTT